MCKCCQACDCKKCKVGMDPKIQFIMGLSAGLASGLIVWLWSRYKRQQEKDSQNNAVPVLLETTRLEEIQPVEDEIISFVLAKLSATYLKSVAQNMENLARSWGEPVRVKFLTTGKGIRPGYQIETVSGDQFQTFTGSNHVPRNPDQRFNPENLTTRFYTQEELYPAV